MFRQIDKDGSGAIDLDEFKVAMYAIDPVTGNSLGFEPNQLLSPKDAFEVRVAECYNRWRRPGPRTPPSPLPCRCLTKTAQEPSTKTSLRGCWSTLVSNCLKSAWKSCSKNTTWYVSLGLGRAPCCTPCADVPLLSPAILTCRAHPPPGRVW